MTERNKRGQFVRGRNDMVLTFENACFYRLEASIVEKPELGDYIVSDEWHEIDAYLNDYFMHLDKNNFVVVFDTEVHVQPDRGSSEGNHERQHAQTCQLE